MKSRHLLCCLLLLPGILISCDRRGSTHGIQDIQVSPGKHLYFKREVRGRNFDSWWISQNRNPCAEFDPSTDAEFPAVGPHSFFYRIDAGKLELFATQSLTMPTQGGIAALIQYEQLNSLEYQKVKAAGQSQGLKVIGVPLDSSIVCF